MRIEITYRLGDETGSQTFTKQKDALTFCEGLTERKAAMCGHTAKDLRALRTIGANLSVDYKERKRVTIEKARWYKTELPKHVAIPLQVQIKTVSDYCIKGDPTVKRETLWNYEAPAKHERQNNTL